MANRFEGPVTAKKAYSNKTHAQSSMTPDFDRTLNSKAAASGRIQLVLPDVKQGRCYFQPFNALDMSDPNNKVLPGRNSEQERDQSDWMVSVPAANYVGIDKKVTFLLYHPDDADDEKPNNPFQIFSRACHAANDAAEFGNGKAWNARWNILVKGKKGAGPAIPKASTFWYMQGALYQNGTKVHAKKDRGYKALGLRSGDPLPILRTSGMCGTGLVTLLDTKKGEEYIYNAVGEQNKKGITGGRILHFYRPTEDMECLKYPNTYDGNWPKGGIISAQIYLRKMIKLGGHECPAEFTKEDLDMIIKSWTPWFEITAGKKTIPGLLHIPSAEEQVELIVRAFSSVPKLPQLAFFDHPEWLELDAVQTILKARASSVSPKDDDDEDEGDDDETPAKKKRLAPVADDDDEDDDDAEDDVVDDEEDDDADDEDSDDDEDEDEKPAKKGKGKKSKSDEDDEDEDSEDDDSDDEEDSDEDDEDEDSEDDDSDDEEDSDEDDEDEDDGDEKPAKKGKKSKSDDDEDEEDEDDEDDDSDDEEDSDEDDDEDSDDDDSDDEDEDEKPKAKKPQAGKGGKKKPAEDEDEDEDSDDDEDDDSEDDEEEAKPAKKGKKATTVDDDEDAFGLDDDEEKVAPAKGGKSKKGKAEVGKVADTKDVKKAIAESTTRAGSRPNKAAKPPASKGGKAKRK